MAYTHKHWALNRHRWSKFTNIQDDNVMSQQAFNEAFPERRLSNWEQFELRDICAEKGIPYPPMEERTLSNFRQITGRDPQIIT